MKRLFLGFVLLLRGFLALANDHTDNWGVPVYKLWIQLAADDAENARQQAQAQLERQIQQPFSQEWIQTFLFLWDSKRERLQQSWQTREFLQNLLETAKPLNLPQLGLRLQFALFQLNPDEAAEEIFIVQSEKIGAFRVAAKALTQKAVAAYDTGNVSAFLSLIQRAYVLLDKRVPKDDLQMLEVLDNMAVFLEFAGEPQKAGDIFKKVIDIHRQEKHRTMLANALTGYALILMAEARFPEAERVLEEVSSIGASLNSALIQGQALKSMGFAWARQKRIKPAIDVYLKSLPLLEEGKEDPVSIADTHRILADCLVLDRQWERALKELDKAAANSTAMQDKDWEKLLQRSRLVALRSLGRTEDALRASIRINELLEQTLGEEQKKEISKLKVSMGLQIEEQKNTSLAEQNQTQLEKLHDAEVTRRFFLGLLVLGALVIVLLAAVLQQTVRAKRSRERMHRILEHIEEGILSIGPGMSVEADFSPYLQKLLNQGVQNPDSNNVFMKLLNAADLQSDLRATILSVLQACIGETSLNWELNSEQLPREISLFEGTIHLLLDWQPVYVDLKSIESILLTVRDITDRKRLQMEVNEARSRASHLEERFADVLRLDARRAQSFVAESSQLLTTIHKSLQTEDNSATTSLSLHTLKGMARSVGFKEMSSLIHDIEDSISIDDNHKEFKTLVNRLDHMQQDYRNLIQKVFHQQDTSNDASLIDIVASSLGAMRALLSQADLELAGVLVHDEVKHWPRAWLHTARVIVLHGITNSADHGFILPKRRGETVTSEPRITITASPDARGLLLEISDNGRGLDMLRLQNLAKSVNFQPKAGQSLADVVFCEGATTAEQVSTSSGRGMGMSAVRKAVENLGGEVHLESNPKGQGSRLIVALPLISDDPSALLAIEKI